MKLRFNDSLRTYLQEAHDAVNIDKPISAPANTWTTADILAYRMGVAQAKIAAALKMLGKDARK